ncbi:protein DDB G0276689-like [Aphis craccivora]|uniref:Protein DDB G0276689-like n=1 Tax=Aphis craccivora TaxID=307492 RepID=A0A6G0WIQ8_APHCR|nr:protein DDB G0276689-like [Aphis craccivora]
MVCVSVPSSGKLYEPSDEFDSDDNRYNNLSQARCILDRANNSIGNTDSVLEDARNLLKLTRNRDQAAEETKMSNFMTTHQALNLIPVFNGENADDSFTFHNACEYALQSIDPAENENLIRGITTRLIGKAIRPLIHKKPSTYKELKEILDLSVNKKQTLTHLHSKLSTFKIAVGETIQQYSDKAEQLYYDIIEASMAANEISNTEDLSKIIERQILSAYTEGLPHNTKILVKASRPNKLSECVQIALEEETSRINRKEIRKNINDYKNNKSDLKSGKSYVSKTNLVQKSNNRPPNACFRCGRTNHQAKQCGASEADQARYRESQNKSKTETKAIRIVTCNYCRKLNHTISECRKRKYVNERKAREQQVSSSGNEQIPGTSGVRPEVDIKTATLNLQGLSTSRQN